MAETVWIIGASMTRFGRYPESDTIDLASQAALGALADAGTEPEKIDLGMRVRLTTFTCGHDEEGTESVAFGFSPV